VSHFDKKKHKKNTLLLDFAQLLVARITIKSLMLKPIPYTILQKKKRLNETELQEIYQELRGISQKLKVSYAVNSINVVLQSPKLTSANHDLYKGQNSKMTIACYYPFLNMAGF
jgi:hypothetical protein